MKFLVAARAGLFLFLCAAGVTGNLAIWIGNTPAAVAMATPIAAGPIMLRIDETTLIDVPHPEWCNCGRAGIGEPSAPLRRDAQASASSTLAPSATTPVREAFRLALTRSSWPMAKWPIVESRVACENTNFDPALIVTDSDGHVSVGYLMIHVIAHPDLAAQFDLTDPVQNLDAGKIAEDKALAAGLPTPWQHCDREAGR